MSREVLAAQMLIATVVGPNGETTPDSANEIHMDRLGRIRIQYEFMRLAEVCDELGPLLLVLLVVGPLAWRCW
jgi:hypothetical protein